MLTSTMPNAHLVEKEEVNGYEFLPANKASKETEEIRKILFDAMMLGNSHHHKVHVAFNTAEGQKQVYTTIWATTDNFIILKGGKYIPINAIEKVALD
jgi:3-deoxy-D-arabino-heptulosonate 7-phosphate (DAHP) synthase